ncbi:MAG: glycosyltransferase, partial [Xanthobacteraceae bacterium]
RPTVPMVLFAGRLIPEKRVLLAVAAMALAAERIDGLRGEFLGDGPERAALDSAIVEHGLQGIVSARGFTETETVDVEMRRAMCVLLTSRREVYGLVVVDSAAGPLKVALCLLLPGIFLILSSRSERRDCVRSVVELSSRPNCIPSPPNR